ncbi:class I SAM-dependent methyltransferase [Shimia sp. R11_0]|uniref:class I SAM-dependent methyltransferase n=1 Tax=Shimia sp. R11_0 TaxID=2821096 RepID=UPI001ADA7310|nr:class I SAM-dependent methyltransferase [Shimia sp. R11_0]MBO9476522.1 class I SAM-dependent methyltransferase [Shimia sp. R11_0]
MQNIAKFWDGIAEKYAKSDIRDMQSYTYTLERTRSYLAHTDRALELGCGTAGTAIALADAVAEMVATDVSNGMLDVGRERAKTAQTSNLQLLQATAETAPDGPFDVVMAHNLLHLLPDPDSAYAAIAARVKPGGLFISKTPCLGEKITSLRVRLIKLALPLLQLLGKAPFVRFVTIAELEAAVTAAGFQIIESGNFPANPPSRYLVARKI